jgi:ornithine cyclodeaminase/alanine dehydrogenase-like protein (mu-crystallin family)
LRLQCGKQIPFYGRIGRYLLSLKPNPSRAESAAVKPIYLSYLNRLDIEELKLSDSEILTAIESSLETQGRGESVMEPRVHLEPGVANGHFNVLRGALREPIDFAGVKVVGDFVDNYKLGLPSKLAVLLLFEATLYAELGQIVAGHKTGRVDDNETILLWHRGLSLSDIALGHAMLEKAAKLDIGQRLRFA